MLFEGKEDARPTQKTCRKQQGGMPGRGREHEARSAQPETGSALSQHPASSGAAGNFAATTSMMDGADSIGALGVRHFGDQPEPATLHACVSGFNHDSTEEPICLIFIKSGTLNLRGCSLSVESLKPHAHRHKIPCLHQLPDTTSVIQRCAFRGCGEGDAPVTTGVFNW